MSSFEDQLMIHRQQQRPMMERSGFNPGIHTEQGVVHVLNPSHEKDGPMIILRTGRDGAEKIGIKVG